MPHSVYFIFLQLLCLLSSPILVNAQCINQKTCFGGNSTTVSHTKSPYTAVTSRESYSVTSSGLEIYLEKPLNDTEDGQGAIINGTTILGPHSKCTFSLIAPCVEGVMTVVRFIGSDSGDRVEIKLLGDSCSNWYTNAFAPESTDPPSSYPQYFSQESVNDITKLNSYSIERSYDAISWSLNDKVAEAVNRGDPRIKGFPGTRLRVEMSISQVDSGSVDWTTAPSKIKATISEVDCVCYYDR
ncbi:hypothetical protein C8J56DRAFT_872266 [Mycena floridula]|nr:hypothetical protein C8J56DRAFT_872266 [Mycena floridula]